MILMKCVIMKWNNNNVCEIIMCNVMKVIMK